MEGGSKPGSQNDVSIPLEEAQPPTVPAQPEPPLDLPADSSAQPNGHSGLTTSFSNPKAQEQASPKAEIEEKAPFLDHDVESLEPSDSSERARQKAMEAGHKEPLPPIQENEYWTDSDDEESEGADGAKPKNILARGILSLQYLVVMSNRKMRQLTRGHLVKAVLLLSFFVYFVAAMIYDHSGEAAHRLIVCTLIGVIIMTADHISRGYSFLSKKLYGADQLSPQHKAIWTKVLVAIRWLLYAGLAAFIIFVIVDEGRKKPENLRGLPGLFLFILILLLCCPKPHLINWHTVYWSMGLQFMFAVFVLKWETGRDSVKYLQDRLDEFFASTNEAKKLVFGDSYMDHKMIFDALPVVFFTNAMLTILYYLGAVQYFVRVCGEFLNFVLDTSPTESTAVVVSMFMEGLSAILTMREYLPYLSKSQLFLVVTSAFASLGGAYLAILSTIGVKLEYLLSAMVISAPATFAVCKIMMPETKWSKEKDQGRQTKIASDSDTQKYNGVIDAGQTGAIMMLNLLGTVVVTIFTFFSFIDWVNSTLGWFGDRVGVDDLSIELICSYLLYPVALMMGIEPDDCRSVGMLLGYRISLNNMMGYLKLNQLTGNRRKFERYMRATAYVGRFVYDGDDIILLDQMNQTLKNGFISPRSEAVVTYSLCGFSSMTSVCIMLGVLTTLVPKRKKWLLSMAFPGLLAGNIANCMTGCFASLFY